MPRTPASSHGTVETGRLGHGPGLLCRLNYRLDSKGMIVHHKADTETNGNPTEATAGSEGFEPGGARDSGWTDP